jgi:hypothetical protein
VAAYSATSTNLFELYSVPGTVLTMVADGTITAGDLVTGGSSTVGRVADTGQTARTSVPIGTCIVGRALQSQTVGNTLLVSYDGSGSFGAGAASSVAWNAITNPTGNQTLTMGTTTTTWTWTSGTTAFSIANGSGTILDLDATNGTLIIGTSSTPTPTSQLQIQGTGTTGQHEADIYNYGYQTAVELNNAGGTAASPTATPMWTGSPVAEIRFAGYDSGFSTGADIGMDALENWVPGSHGARLYLAATAIGSPTRVDVFWIDPTNGLLAVSGAPITTSGPISAGTVGVGQGTTLPAGASVMQLTAGSQVASVTSGTTTAVITSNTTAGQDVGASIGFVGYINGTGFPRNFGVIAGRKETSGQGNQNGYLSFLTNNAGTLTEQLHIASNGAATFTSTVSTSGTILTAAAPTVSASQIGYGGSVAASTNCGTIGTGCVVINVAGTTRYVTYY